MGKYSIIITDRILIMSAFWRVAGLNYVQYSNIAAKTVRQALKGDAKDAAAKRGNQLSRVAGTTLAFVFLDIVSIKFQKWEGGKPLGEKK